jgi:hypothetical protein
LILAFRPPSADKLYQQAKRVMQSGDFEKQEAAIEPDGAIYNYLKHYPERNDEQAQEVRGWDEQVRVAQCENLLADYLRRIRQDSFKKREPTNKTEEDAFAAVKAEGEGDQARAAELWQRVEQGSSRSWQRVAQKHQSELSALNQIDKDFRALYDPIEESGEEPQLPNARQRQAFLAWRAEHSTVQDHRLSAKLFRVLKGETTTESGPSRRWFLYAAWNVRKLADARQGEKESDKDKDDVEKRVLKLLEETRESRQKTLTRKAALLRCLDVMALYENDEEMKTVVEKARTLRDDILKEAKNR